MESNFTFLKPDFKTLFEKAQKAEQSAVTDPRTSLIYCRMALEQGVKWMYANDQKLKPHQDTTLQNLIAQPEFKMQLNHKLYGDLFVIKKTGNLAVHNQKVIDIDAFNAVEALFYFSKWWAKTYTDDFKDPGIFDFNLIPEEGFEALTKKQINKLQEKLDGELSRFQQELEEEQEKNKKLIKENELFKKRNEELQADIEKNKAAANRQDQETTPRSERETREQLINLALREAGWDLKGVNDQEFKVSHMPKSSNPSGIGYVDYVLWDDDGLPLALVEAKNTLKNVTTGENQAQLYADALEKMYKRRPVMFYSNGYEIYMWDDRFYKVARPVNGFYTKSELQTLMYRRDHRKDIRKAPIDTNIAGRPYQMRAIKSISEHIAGDDASSKKLIGMNRAALLVLATGTGKTRTAIAFSKLLLQSNWAKRILFLADRVSLVKQAKSNFVKLLPEHTSVNLITQKDNPDARLAFSTYQTMMRLIDDIKNDEQRYYGVGHFDLIIIDEAHRSIYKKYQSIFDYFDAILLGLTATPKNNIHHNTYKVFDLPDKSPTDAYSFNQAVKDGYLVPYKTIESPTKFLTTGISYEDLSDKEKEEFEDEILDGEEATGSERIAPNELNAWLFNIDTAKKTISFILKNAIKKRGGDEIGKTIIFARNKKHAHFLKDMFLEMDKERFGNEYVKVITHDEPKAQTFIERFCDEQKDQLPQIVISVDMMDTGIDAPSCVNLVFYKPVKSYTKFWQMIGRGSRLRPELFGPGVDKEKFIIFDLLGNFEFFRENPEGIEPKIQKSITEIVFSLKLQLAEYLKLEKFKDDPELQAYKDNLVDELYNSVKQLDRNRFDVKMNLKVVNKYGGDNRSSWDHLSGRDIKILKEEVAPLIPPKEGESDLARFYDKLLYSLMIERLETPDAKQFRDELSIPITKVAILSQKLLKKTSIPQVKAKEHIIKKPLDEEFWLTDGLKHLEKIRSGIRNLLVYIDKEDQRYVTTDFKDELDENNVVITDHDTVKEADSDYQNTSTTFKNNLKRLEAIIEDNKEHVTIKRIRSGDAITEQELRSLENILFDDSLTKEALENEIGTKVDLVSLIVSLTGLDRENIDLAFADFINKYQLNSQQTRFLEMIKEFFTKNGSLDPGKLYESPFKNIHSQGVDGIFNDEQADSLINIVEKINDKNSSA